MKNYEFNMKLQNRENLLNIYRTLEPLSSFSKYNDWLAMIVPDNYKEICLEDQKKLTKPNRSIIIGLEPKMNLMLWL